MSEVTIYYYDGCPTCRNARSIIEGEGLAPKIIDYMDSDRLSRTELLDLLSKVKMSARELLRRKAPIFDELSLDDPKWSDDQILDLMVEHPELISRPIVITEKGTRLCRPAETVKDLL